MYAQMGLTTLKAGLGHIAAKGQFKLDKMQQDYNNAMQAIATAQQNNALTHQEVNARDASVRAAQSVELQALQDKSSATASAASAGVRGGSVRATMNGLSRSRMQAKFALQERMKSQANANTQNRRNVAMSAVYSKDISVIPRPSAASALLGLSASIIDIYDSHQPEGQKVSDTLAGLGRD